MEFQMMEYSIFLWLKKTDLQLVQNDLAVQVLECKG
jgi:hypothetical protein